MLDLNPMSQVQSMHPYQRHYEPYGCPFDVGSKFLPIVEAMQQLSPMCIQSCLDICLIRQFVFLFLLTAHLDSRIFFSLGT